MPFTWKTPWLVGLSRQKGSRGILVSDKARQQAPFKDCAECHNLLRPFRDHAPLGKFYQFLGPEANHVAIHATVYDPGVSVNAVAQNIADHPGLLGGSKITIGDELGAADLTRIWHSQADHCMVGCPVEVEHLLHHWLRHQRVAALGAVA